MKNNKGFSLVELIVVIAIMAILAAVAVVGVSVYIPKAQQANDKQLVGDIVYAIELRDYETQFAANSNGVVGYVVVTQDGVTASGEEVIEALKAVYGDNYATSSDLKLSYDGWTDTALMLQQVNNDEIKPYIGSVNESTYVDRIGTDELLEDAQGCATKFGEFLNQISTDPAQATNKLINGFESDDQAVVEEILKNAGYEGKYDQVTPEILQNVTAFAVASVVKENKQDVVDKFASEGFLAAGVANTTSLDQVATWYAAAEALVFYLNDASCTEAFEGIDMTGSASDIAASMVAAHSKIAEKISDSSKASNEKERQLAQNYYDYYNKTDSDGKTQAKKDGEAYVAIMSSVDNVSNEYIKDQASLKNNNLFNDGTMNNRVNTYIAAANLADKIEADEQLSSLLEGEKSAVIVIACANNGVLECLLLPAEVVG